MVQVTVAAEAGPEAATHNSSSVIKPRCRRGRFATARPLIRTRLVSLAMIHTLAEKLAIPHGVTATFANQNRLRVYVPNCEPPMSTAAGWPRLSRIAR